MTIEDRLSELSFGKALVISFVFAGLYYLIMYDAGTAVEAKIKASQQIIVQSQKELENIKVQIEEAESYAVTKARMGKELAQIIKYLPEDLTVFYLMKVLSEEARASGVDIITIRDSSKSNVRTSNSDEVYYEKVPVAVELQGTFSGLLTFLSNITKVERILMVKKLSFQIKPGNVTKQGENGTLLKMDAVIEAYKYKRDDSKKGGA